MESDLMGFSTCQAGEERCQLYYSPIVKKTMVQYDFRTKSGKLFSCVALTIEKCREKKDNWLTQMN